MMAPGCQGAAANGCQVLGHSLLQELMRTDCIISSFSQAAQDTISYFGTKTIQNTALSAMIFKLECPLAIYGRSSFLKEKGGGRSDFAAFKTTLEKSPNCMLQEPFPIV